MFQKEVAAAIATHTVLDQQEVEALLERPPDDKLGDYAFPCFTLAKTEKKAPPKIAQELAGKISPTGAIAKAEAVGPYVNLFLRPASILEAAMSAALQPGYGKGDKRADKVMVEYSQPNTHKAFHVGHIRGTAIGEALSRILKYAGYEVIQANYSGDTGMHVAKWIWCYDRFHKGEEPPADAKGKWLASIYVEAVRRLAEDPGLEAEVKEINLALERQDDPALMAFWKKTRQWSIDELERIYNELDAHFDYWWFEREVEARGKEIARELEQRGIAKESDGALIVDLEPYKLGTFVLLRQDGTALYSAKDLALAESKFTKYNIDRSIYVVGKEQEHYFRQLFKTLELMGFKQAKKCFHLSFELVRLPEGKMSSRTGNNIIYNDMRDEVFAFTEKEIKSRHPEWDEQKIADTTAAVGVCALKFEMIFRDHNKVIIYDIARVCDFEGDTGPYIQYTHARCNSILKKLGRKPKPDRAAFASLTAEQEIRLAKKLLAFPAAIEEVAETLMPNAVAKYTLELARAFNSFYHECKVVGEPSELENARALLVDATRQTLARALELLGIAAPEEM